MKPQINISHTFLWISPHQQRGSLWARPAGLFKPPLYLGFLLFFFLRPPANTKKDTDLDDRPTATTQNKKYQNGAT